MSVPIIVGADVSSSRLALVACDEGGNLLALRKFALAKRSGPDAVYEGYRQTRRFLKQFTGLTVYVFIEDALAGRGGVKATKVQAYTNGGVQAASYGRAEGVYLVNVGTWKKAIIGKGNATKDEVASCIQEIWQEAGEEAGNDQDLLDAAAIALYGAGVVRRGTAMAGPGGV